MRTRGRSGFVDLIIYKCYVIFGAVERDLSRLISLAEK